MNRIDLLKKLELVSPALSDNTLIPALTHLWFTGENVMAYNDQIAISTPLVTDFQGAVPGNVLLSLLKASKAKEVTLTLENDNLLVKAASSKWRLAVLPPEAFIFDIPKPTKATLLQGKYKEFLASISACLRSVSAGGTIPDVLGVTLIPHPEGEKGLFLFATDDNTISCSRLTEKCSLKERVILPEAFCKQLVSLGKADKPHLEVNTEYALLTTAEATLFGRLLESPSPLDFVSIVGKHTPNGFKKEMIAVPTMLEGILTRAIIINDTNSNDRQPTLITVKERGVMRFHTKSDRGEAHDAVKIEQQQKEVSVRAEAKLIKEGFGFFDKWAVTKSAILMTKDDHLYLIGVKS